MLAVLAIAACVLLIGAVALVGTKWSRASAGTLPNTEPALKNYIVGEIKKKNVGSAQSGVKALEALKGSDIEIHQFQGMIFILQKDYPAARESLQKALAMNSDYKPALDYLATVEMISGQYAKAEEYLKGIDLTPPYNPSIAYRLYLCALLENDQEKAAKILKVSPITPQNPEYYYLPVAAAAVAGKKDEAIRLRDTARTMAPGDYRRHEELLSDLKLL